MLELGSALEDETLTIRFVTLENPEIFSQKYLAAHLDEITTNLPFSDSRRKRVKSSHCGLSWSQSSERIQVSGRILPTKISGFSRVTNLMVRV